MWTVVVLECGMIVLCLSEPEKGGSTLLKCGRGESKGLIESGAPDSMVLET